MLIGPITEHLQEKYPTLDLMTPSQIQQLAWNAKTANPTSEKDVTAKVPPHVEVLRCTSRLYNLGLLYQGSATHAQFIEPQDTLNEFSPHLSAADYAILCQRFAGHDALKQETLRVATIISSVLSPTAKEQADKVLGKNKWSTDSVEFFADAFHDIDKAKAIFPLVKELFEKYPAATDQARIQAYLQTAFAHATHYRHMLYTEGSGKMFHQLLKEHKEGKITADTLNFMISYWTVNIAGFRAQLDGNVKGSNYLTANTFKAMRALEAQLQRIFTEPNVTENDMLYGYLDARAEFLQLDNLSKRGDIVAHIKYTDDERRFLAHIGALMRLFTPEEGGVLALGFSRIPAESRRHFMSLYFQYELPTPTYGPSVFQNGIDYRQTVYGNSVLSQVTKQNYTPDVLKFVHLARRLMAIADITVGYLPLYLDVISRHQQLVAEEKLPKDVPLNFNGIAFNQNIAKFCASSPIIDTTYDVFDELAFTLDQDSKVGVDVLPGFQAKAAAAAARVAAAAALAASTAAQEASDAAIQAAKKQRRGEFPAFALASRASDAAQQATVSATTAVDDKTPKAAGLKQ